VQQAKENDPKELKRRIVELERKLQTQKPAPAVDQNAIEKTIAKALAEQEKHYRSHIQGLERTIGKMQLTINKARGVLGDISVEDKSISLPAFTAVYSTAPAPAAKPIVRQSSSRQPAISEQTQGWINVIKKGGSGSDVTLPQGEKTVLIAIASYPDGVERDTLSVLTGYKRSSRDTYIQRLREKGYVNTSNNSITVTDEGIEALGSDYEPLPVGTELQEYWLGRLPEGEKRVLEVLIAAYPDSVRRDAIDETTGYKRSSRDTYLQRLGARRLVESMGGGMVRSSKDLFD
jgi:hypothetical protein